MALDTTTITVEFPLKGKNDAWPRNAQPVLTTVDCLNVLPMDRTYRARGGQRVGVSEPYVSAWGSGPVQCMFQGYSTTGTDYLVGVSGGDLFRSSARVTNGVSPALAGTNVSGCFYRGTAYFVDGVAGVHTLALSGGGSAAAMVASAGSVPTGCNLACMWNGRLVVGGPSHLWYMSAINAPADWDYGAAGASRAFSGSSSVIKSPLTALIPFSNDVLLFGQDQRIDRMVGDPGLGGSILEVSGNTGIVGKDAWCFDADRRLWFVGTGGLFVYDGATVRNVSGPNLASYFNAINRSTHTISMAFDRQRRNIWIFVTRTDGSVASTHMVYNLDTEGWFPQQFPIAVGPRAVCVYDGDAPNDRKIMLGTTAGNIYVLRDDASLGVTDDPVDQAIESYVWIGPIKPFGDGRDAKLKWIDPVLGEWSTTDINRPPKVYWNCEWTVQCGETEFSALYNPAQTRTGRFVKLGRMGATGLEPTTRIGLEMQAKVFYIKLANDLLDKTWSIDHLTLGFVPGRVR